MSYLYSGLILCHLTVKAGAKISWFPLQRWSKSELKTKNWNYTGLLSNLAKEEVGKRFFNLASFHIGIKLYVKVNSSLARSRWSGPNGVSRPRVPRSRHFLRFSDFVGFISWFLRKWSPVCKNWSQGSGLREHRQKTFITLSEFWPLRGWG